MNKPLFTACSFPAPGALLAPCALLAPSALLTPPSLLPLFTPGPVPPSLPTP